MTAPESSHGSESSDYSTRAAQILAESRVWDMTLPYWDLETMARCKKAGYKFVSATMQDDAITYEGTKRAIEQFRQIVGEQADWVEVATTLADIERVRLSGKLAVGMHLQSTLQLGNQLARVQEMYDLGVRHMLLAYQSRNMVADGCAERSDAGLSNFGRLVIREMNRVGIVVDGSHTGRRSSLEAIELSELPPIFSHSNAFAVCPHIRNLHDDQIRACADRGGVVGVVGIGAFLCDALARAESLFRHIEYMVNLVGPDHVGIGTDYVINLDPLWAIVKNQKDTAWPDPTGTQLYEGVSFRPEQLSELVELMLRSGYPTDAMKGILGENFRRVYAQTEQAVR